MAKLILAFAAGVFAAGAGILLWTQNRPDETVFVQPAPQAPRLDTASPAAHTTQQSPTFTAKAPARQPAARAIAIAKPSAKVETVPAEIQNEEPVAVKAPIVGPAPVPTPLPIGDPVPSQPATPPAQRAPRTALVPAGTLITVRLLEPLSSNQSQTGYVFRTSLDQPLVVSSMVLAERGSQQLGKVVFASKGGRVKGRAMLSLELTELQTADGQKVAIQTETFVHQADATPVWQEAAKAGAAAAVGAAIGAMAGGGKGAGIGAAIGGAVGTGAALTTRGPEAKLEEETRISFRLREPITLTERVN